MSEFRWGSSKENDFLDERKSIAKKNRACGAYIKKKKLKNSIFSDFQKLSTGAYQVGEYYIHIGNLIVF